MRATVCTAYAFACASLFYIVCHEVPAWSSLPAWYTLPFGCAVGFLSGIWHTRGGR